MTNDGAALFTTILGRPDDDTARLVYADWLDEHDDPEWAEFIRVQCALARGGMSEEERKELRKRQYSLLEKNEKKWTPDFTGAISKMTNIEYERGFPSEVYYTHGCPRDFQKELEFIVKTLPLETLRFSEVSNDNEIRALAQCPQLGQLYKLSIGGLISDESTRALAQSPHTKRLKSLSLWSNPTFERRHLTNASAEIIAAAGAFPNLRHMKCHGHCIGSAGIRTILTSTHLPQFRELEIDGIRLTPEDAAAIAQCPEVAKMECLRFPYATLYLSNATLQALAASPYFSPDMQVDMYSSDRSSFCGTFAEFQNWVQQRIHSATGVGLT